MEGCNQREGYDEAELQWESAHERRQHEIKLKKMEDRMREQAEMFRQRWRAEGLVGADSAAAEAASTATAAAAAALPPMEEAAAEGEEGAGGGRRKRRAASAKVDYVALAKKMKEEEKDTGNPEGAAAAPTES